MEDTVNAEEVNVLIAGGGVAALEASLALQSFGDDRLDVRLLAAEPRFWYRPVAVAEPFALGRVSSFDLSTLAAQAGASVTLGRLVSVDAARRIAYTKPGGAMEYSLLLIACGAVPVQAVNGALTFRGPADTEQIVKLLGEIGEGTVRRVAFVVPFGAAWSVPAYELALMTAGWASARGVDLDVVLVTPEDEPLQLFGRDASEAVRALLEARGVGVHTGSYAAEARDGELLLVDGAVLAADRVVALPLLRGPRIGGVPQTFDGFIPVDSHGRVVGLSDVYAAGDVTSFAVKQGGIAAQQADAAAEAIAAAAGIGVEPRPFRPVLRGVLLTGDGPRFLRGDRAETGERSEVSEEPLWWPPAKIVGRYLAPFLSRLSGATVEAEPSSETGVSVDVELKPDSVLYPRDRLVRRFLEEAHREPGTPTVGDVMEREPLQVAPEDTLGEIAERMSELDRGSALVVEFGRLIGILTSRDMLRALAGRVHSSEARARQWMTADPISVNADDTLETAKIMMAAHRIHHLPVVDGERAVGMVGLRDVVQREIIPMAIGLGL
jgi:sulfide:quinone oxidoreductase